MISQQSMQLGIRRFDCTVCSQLRNQLGNERGVQPGSLRGSGTSLGSQWGSPLGCLLNLQQCWADGMPKFLCVHLHLVWRTDACLKRWTR
jgi:hypothetical protein